MTRNKVPIVAVYLLVTAGLFTINLSKSCQVSKLESELSLVTERYVSKQELSQTARNSFINLRKLKFRRRKMTRQMRRFFSGEQIYQFTSTQLFNEKTTTFVASKNVVGEMLHVFTIEKEPIEILIEVIHRKGSSGPKLETVADGDLINEYRFVFPVKAETWNIFGVKIISDGDRDPVVAMVDDELEIVGSLPDFGNKISESSPATFFFGTPSDENVFLSQKPSRFYTLVRSKAPNSTEWIHIDVTARKATKESLIDSK